MFCGNYDYVCRFVDYGAWCFLAFTVWVGYCVYVLCRFVDFGCLLDKFGKGCFMCFGFSFCFRGMLFWMFDYFRVFACDYLLGWLELLMLIDFLLKFVFIVF